MHNEDAPTDRGKRAKPPAHPPGDAGTKKRRSTSSSSTSSAGASTSAAGLNPERSTSGEMDDDSGAVRRQSDRCHESPAGGPTPSDLGVPGSIPRGRARSWTASFEGSSYGVYVRAAAPSSPPPPMPPPVVPRRRHHPRQCSLKSQPLRCQRCRHHPPSPRSAQPSPLSSSPPLPPLPSLRRRRHRCLAAAAIASPPPPYCSDRNRRHRCQPILRRRSRRCHLKQLAPSPPLLDAGWLCCVVQASALPTSVRRDFRDLAMRCLLCSYLVCVCCFLLN